MGLRVLFKTWRTPSPPHETIEVWYANEALLVVDTGKSLRTALVPMHVRHDENGLHVTHNGKQWIDSYKIRDWDPLASWRLGFGARGASTIDDHAWGRSEDYPTSPERHWIENLTISSGLLIAEATAPVSLSFNGQQYNPVPLEFDYYAMPSCLVGHAYNRALRQAERSSRFTDRSSMRVSSRPRAVRSCSGRRSDVAHKQPFTRLPMPLQQGAVLRRSSGERGLWRQTVQAHDLCDAPPGKYHGGRPSRNACYVGPDQLLPESRVRRLGLSVWLASRQCNLQ